MLGESSADVLGQLGMAEDDFTVTVSTTTNNDHDQEVRRYEALEPMIVSGEQTGNVALEFLDGQLALCSVVVGYTRIRERRLINCLLKRFAAMMKNIRGIRNMFRR